MCLVVVAAWHFFGDELRVWMDWPTSAMPQKRDTLRVVTWNLENFPSEHQDLPALRRRLLELDPDLVAVQEVKDPDRLRALLPDYELVISEGGGRGHQRVGVLFDPATVTVRGVREHEDITLDGRLRPALTAYVAHRGAGPDFHVAVVHLKARPEGFDQRREQVPDLSKILADLPSAGPGRGDPDLVLLGDFNVVGGEDGRPSAGEELAELEAALAPLGLRRVDVPRGCSAYWDGERRDAWKEPSLLDLIWLGAFAEAGAEPLRARVGTHCGKHACSPFRSTEAYPEATYEAVSDHCPVVLDLALVDDDP